MTRFLASVRDAAETETVLAAGADIVDLKDPANGALGAVATDTVRACVARVSGRKPVSATIGDLPMVPRTVALAVAARSALGVDDVKLGVMPGGDPHGCFARLRDLEFEAGLILVFFADAMPAFDPVEAAQRAGAHGIMLDTMGKDGGALTQHIAPDEIARFVDVGRRSGLLVGLAGSLRVSHVAPLLAFGPDVIGFRGALCHEGERSSGLDRKACNEIRSLIPANLDITAEGFGEPQAPALC